jgi:hypothetical protein
MFSKYTPLHVSAIERVSRISASRSNGDSKLILYNVSFLIISSEDVISDLTASCSRCADSTIASDLKFWDEYFSILREEQPRVGEAKHSAMMAAMVV